MKCILFSRIILFLIKGRDYGRPLRLRRLRCSGNLEKRKLPGRAFGHLEPGSDSVRPGGGSSPLRKLQPGRRQSATTDPSWKTQTSKSPLQRLERSHSQHASGILELPNLLILQMIILKSFVFNYFGFVINLITFSAQLFGKYKRAKTKINIRKRITISEIKSHPWFLHEEFLLYLDHYYFSENFNNNSYQLQKVITFPISWKIQIQKITDIQSRYVALIISSKPHSSI